MITLNGFEPALNWVPFFEAFVARKKIGLSVRKSEKQWVSLTKKSLFKSMKGTYSIVALRPVYYDVPIEYVT